MSDDNLLSKQASQGHGYILDRDRLAAVAAYSTLDEMPISPLEDLLKLAAYICNTPMAAVTLVEETRQHFISKLGIDAQEAALGSGFCAEVVIQRQPLIISDTYANRCFAARADAAREVAEDPIRFYAGVPLTTPQNHVVGALCVFDIVPHDLQTAQLEALESIGRQAVNQLELRLSTQQIEKMSKALTDISYGVASSMGSTFFPTLVQHFTETLDVEYAYVGILRSDSASAADHSFAQSQRASLGSTHQTVAQLVRQSLNQVMKRCPNLKARQDSAQQECEQIDSKTDTVQTLAVCHKGKIIDNFSYRLEDVPCSHVLSQNSFCHHTEDLKVLFPDSPVLSPLSIDSYAATSVVDANGRPVGVLAVMDKKPLKTTKVIRSMLTMFSVRIAAELERYCVELEKADLLAREQEARRQAEMAARMKDDFLAVISHELRSPLNPIVGWSKLLRKEGIPQERRRNALESIERNALVQVKIIDELIDASKVLRQRVSLQKIPVPMSVVTTSVLTKLQPKIKAKSIDCQMVDLSEGAMVNGDIARLQQIVEKLLDNAIKFTPEGGQVRIELSTRTGCLPEAESHSGECRYVQLQITDTGRGISAQFLPNVFERFRQEDASTTRQFGGLGIGLAIAQQLAKMHNGIIEVESAGAQKGATFTVKLPTH